MKTTGKNRYGRKDLTMETTTILTTRSFSWHTLLSLSALANLAVLLFMNLTNGDTLALVLTAITLAGLALTRFRRGLLGGLVLGLLFTDIMIWTLSGAVNNFLHGERGLALLLPSFLGVISLTGLVAALGMFITRRNPGQASQAAALVGGFGAGMLLIAAAASLFLRPDMTFLPQQVEILLGSKNMVYSTSEIQASAGEITVTLANEDLWWHTFTIDELGIDLNVPMKAERSVTFKAPPGEYRFYCGIPGHEALGMEGTLVVEE
jgi:plastocyanin